MKKIFSVILVIVLGVILSGCGKKNKDPEIQFMTWGSSTEMEIIKPVIDDYNKSHIVKVKLIHVPQNYFQKLHLLFASNLAPDVIFINNLYLKIYQEADLLEDLTSITDKSKYFENALKTLSSNGRVYAVPRDVSSIVVFYNKNLFKKNGVKIPEDWTIDNFYNISKNLKNNENYGFCTEFEPGYFENFISIENKPLFYDEKLTIGEQKSINAMQRLADAINKEGLSADKEQLALTPCAQLFLQQKSPMFISGRWSLPKIEKSAGFEYGILPFPKGNSKFYIPLNASGWAISKKSKNKAAAMDFVKYLSSDENIERLTASGLITPAQKNAANSDFFKNGEVFIKTIENSTPNIVPKDYNQIIDKVKNSSASVLGGYKSAQEAFEKF